MVVYCASSRVFLNGILMHSSGILSFMVIYDEADCALMWILWYTVSRSILPIKIWKSDYLVFIDMKMWSRSWRHKPYKKGLLGLWWYCCWMRVHRLMVRSINVWPFVWLVCVLPHIWNNVLLLSVVPLLCPLIISGRILSVGGTITHLLTDK